MSDSSPRLERTDTPDGPCVRLLGRWGAAQLGTRAQWRALSVQLRGQRAAAGLGWDLRGLEWLDHVGAQLLWNHWGRAWPERLALDASQRAMLDRVARLSCTAAPPEPWRLADQIDRLGTLVMHGVDHARHLLLLVGQLLLDSLRVLRAPRRAPWRDVSGHLYSMGAMALPITALVGFLIGVVLAYLMSLQLRQFGAEAFIVNILGHLADPRAGAAAGRHFGGGAIGLGHHGADRRHARDRRIGCHERHGHTARLSAGAAARAGTGHCHAADQHLDYAGRTGGRHAGR